MIAAEIGCPLLVAFDVVDLVFGKISMRDERGEGLIGHRWRYSADICKSGLEDFVPELANLRGNYGNFDLGHNELYDDFG